MIALGNSWADWLETVTLLRDLASDPDRRIRQAAVTALGNTRPGNLETLRLLRRQAICDPDSLVRRAASKAILQSAG